MATSVIVRSSFYYPANTPLTVGSTVSLPDDLAAQQVSAGKAAYVTPPASDKQDLTDAERAWVKQSAVSGGGISADAGNALTLGTDSKPLLSSPSQATAEAGTDTTLGAWSVLRVWQAIKKALGGVSVSNTPATGQVLTATSTSAAAWSTPSAGAAAGSTTQLQFNDGGAFAGASGLTWAKATNTLVIASGTKTASDPHQITFTWNNVSQLFRGVDIIATDTNSAAGSTPFRVMGGSAGTTTLFSVSKTGAVVLNDGANGSITAGSGSTALALGTNFFSINPGGGSAHTVTVVDSAAFTLPSSYPLRWASGAFPAGPDLQIARVAAGVLRLSHPSGTTPGVMSLDAKAVSTLPAAATVGIGVCAVNDLTSTTTGIAPVGGGSNKGIVWSTGSAWLVLAAA